MRALRIALTLLLAGAAAEPCCGGYPFFSLFTTPANGPYAPRVHRYIVVDPAPAAQHGSYDPHGGHAASHAHHGAAPTGPLWTRHDAPQPAYPYGWFGARAATKDWSHTGYYDNYVDHRYLRGN